MKRMIALFLPMVAASGCGWQPVMHESWAEQVAVGDGACPDIDGLYKNAGERSVPLRDENWYLSRDMTLSHILNGDPTWSHHENSARLGTTWMYPDDDPIRAVRVINLGDVLRFEAVAMDGRRAYFELPARHSCEDSLVLVKDWAVDNRGEEYPVDADEGLAFGRLVDGSLLVRTSWKLATPGFGTHLVLFADYFNYRFAPLAPPRGSDR